ncbi:hypothetical protein Vadar_019695 [Vaccinium darrowii]|uniref:Uncharacterized protein n=1 Tax=Vaccinium darrowii TaxID=229202 RepID=A0ACB7ZK98_9ERIC|nr:hypothetical protein Vadar_019695 [Vaccinium darrowii]
MEESMELDVVETLNNDVEGLKAPSNEMSFETMDEARKYYEDYGRQKGFWIRTRTSSKGRNRSSAVSSMLFVCAREGKHVARTKNDVVVEGNDEREEGENIFDAKARMAFLDVNSCLFGTEKETVKIPLMTPCKLMKLSPQLEE